MKKPAGKLYGYTFGGLQRALKDKITEWTKDGPELKCVNGETPPKIALVPPYVYIGYIPSNLLSPEGMSNPPVVPSILIDAHSAKTTVIPQGEIMVDVRILISVWDDSPDYLGNEDNKLLMEKIFLKMLRERDPFAGEYEMTGDISCKVVPAGRSNYFVSIIDATYNLGPAPDDSDNINLDLDVYTDGNAFTFGR
jgi:hypothetical protein